MEWRKNHSSQICSENADNGMGAIVAAGLEECSQTPASQLSALLQVMQVLRGRRGLDGGIRENFEKEL